MSDEIDRSIDKMLIPGNELTVDNVIKLFEHIVGRNVTKEERKEIAEGLQNGTTKDN